MGTTSKQLTESIGERVALKAKGAKHKLDKNLKSSSELLSNLGTETSNRLKSVSKRFGTNFTLNKKDKEIKEDMPSQFYADRPQTVPPNGEVFQSITFSSPLNKKAGGLTDLSSVVESSDCYEVPKNVRIAQHDNNAVHPPSYDEVLLETKNFSRNLPASKSLMVPKHMSEEAAAIGKSRSQGSSNSLNKVVEETSENSSRDSLDSFSPPMPDFPAPVLNHFAEQSEEENGYGKLNPIKPPIRQKRRKNYEEIQLRRNLNEASAVRPQLDSAELQKLNAEAAEAERQQSILLREQLKAAEASTPKPDRSESWEYFRDDDNNDDDGESDEASSPEPVYANHDATYGRICEMGTSDSDLLPASRSSSGRGNTLKSINEDEEGACGGSWLPPKPAPEVIQEFDPLLRKRCATICNSNKSNELLLLEHLLEEETYGTLKRSQNKSDDDISTCTSEEDNVNVTAQKTTTASNLVVVLPSDSQIKETALNSKEPMQIVHQNAHLLSESMENMLDKDEESIKPFLMKQNNKTTNQTGPTDLSHPNQARSNWFLQEDKENSNSSSTSNRQNPFNKLNIEGGESPPSYLEAIGEDGKSNTIQEPKSRTSRLMNSLVKMNSNVKIKVEALKRKSSFKAAQTNPDVKVILKMIPRPSLSPLLVRYEGPLIRFPSGVVEDILKEMQHRRAILRDRQFQTYLDSEMKNLKETIPLEYITTLQCVSNSRVTDNSTHFYCFEITTSIPKNSGGNSLATIQAMSNPNTIMTSGSSGNCKHQRVSHLYGVGKESER